MAVKLHIILRYTSYLIAFSVFGYALIFRIYFTFPTPKPNNNMNLFFNKSGTVVGFYPEDFEGVCVFRIYFEVLPRELLLY